MISKNDFGLANTLNGIHPNDVSELKKRIEHAKNEWCNA